MNEIKVFDNPTWGKIRVVVIDDVVWLVGRDVAIALGYSNTKDAISSHVDAEDKQVIQRSENATFEIPNRGMTVINESGLYSLVLSSKLPNAKAFKRWVTAEVLPSIRKHGMYATIGTVDAMLADPDTAIQILTAYKDERNKRLALQAKVEQDAPKVLLAESIQASEDTILIGELAKILKQNGVDTGEKRLFAWLRANGYLIRRVGRDHNMPTQFAMERGLFRIKECTTTDPDGSNRIRKTTTVTAAGQQYFVNLFLANVQMVLPCAATA